MLEVHVQLETPENVMILLDKDNIYMLFIIICKYVIYFSLIKMI